MSDLWFARQGVEHGFSVEKLGLEKWYFDMHLHT